MSSRRVILIVCCGFAVLIVGLLGIHAYAAAKTRNVFAHPPTIDQALPPAIEGQHVRAYPAPTTNPTAHFHGPVVTPETMQQFGLDIQFRFRDMTIKRGREPTTRTGSVLIQAIFDQKKGPAISRVGAIYLNVEDGQRSVLTVPLEHRAGWVQFSLDDSLIPKSQLVLDFYDGLHARRCYVPIESFDR